MLDQMLSYLEEFEAFVGEVLRFVVRGEEFGPVG
jgi:hypothetical protein